MTDIPPGMSPVERLGPGSRIREWQVVRRIARGSFGTVFEARRDSWVDDSPPRALKVFDPILSSAARSNLVDEFMVLRTIRHPNLVSGHDAFDLVDGDLGGCVVFVMDLAEVDLGDLVARSGPLPASDVSAIGIEVARGLAALHGAELIHGDVKPDNILREGSAWKLGDFGVTAPLEGSYAMPVASTLDFRPPEVSGANSRGVHRSADLWALGVTLWITAAGEHPFVGVDPQVRHAAVLRGDRRMNGRIDAELAELLNRTCLEPDPRRRASASEFGRQLSLLGTPRGVSQAGEGGGRRGVSSFGGPAAQATEPRQPAEPAEPRQPAEPAEPRHPAEPADKPAGPAIEPAEPLVSSASGAGPVPFALSVAFGALAGVLISFLVSWAVSPLPLGLWPRRLSYLIICIAGLGLSNQWLGGKRIGFLNRQLTSLGAAISIAVATLLLFGLL